MGKNDLESISLALPLSISTGRLFFVLHTVIITGIFGLHTNFLLSLQCPPSVQRVISHSLCLAANLIIHATHSLNSFRAYVKWASYVLCTLGIIWALYLPHIWECIHLVRFCWSLCTSGLQCFNFKLFIFCSGKVECSDISEWWPDMVHMAHKQGQPSVCVWLSAG